MPDGIRDLGGKYEAWNIAGQRTAIRNKANGRKIRAKKAKEQEQKEPMLKPLEVWGISLTNQVQDMSGSPRGVGMSGSGLKNKAQNLPEKTKDTS